MSLDGSFNLHMEFERLILRCPKLSFVANFSSLPKKGNELKEDEVVNVLANVFLHPNYTIPIMGCFRPISRKIIERVVELLKMVPQLRFDHPHGVVNSVNDRFFVGCEEFDDIESVGVIELYSRCGRFLDLHELACLAFCRVLDLAPFLKWVVDCYYEFGGPPFARIIEMTSISGLSTDVARHMRDIVWTSYRFLLLEPESFSSRWNWCCFLDLVHQSRSCDASSDDGLVRDIIWCAVQILCVLLRLPNRSASFGVQPVEGLTCLLRWREFSCDVSLEKAGWYTSKTKALQFSDGVPVFNGDDSIAVNGLELLDHTPPKRSRSLMRNCEPFLMTSSMKICFERIVMAVNQRWPVLLYGPPGCGKTALLNKLAEESGNQVLSIHMDEHIDGKTLIGSYVCSEQPGEFRWQPGPLTQAVKAGFWVVFENIDQAASDVQSILLPLLEGNSSFMTGYGEAIRVAGSFRLFSTISTSKVDVYHCTEGRTSLSSLWRRVMVRPAGTTDLVNIVTAWYPDLEPVAKKLIETFERLNGASELIVPSNINSSGKFSLRDLLKWCKRISGSGMSFSADRLSVDTHSCIFREAVDVFAAYSPSPEKRLDIVRDIAKMLGVPLTRAETLYCLDRPVLQEFHGAVQIGRVTLHRSEDAVSHEKKPFVEIRSSFHVLERIACAVKWNEPILLVGETGTGKTTLVQNLAARLGQKLSVLNLSQQSDVADLLGGFKPMDPQHICIPLYKEFENLFSLTFSLKDNETLLSRLRKHVSKKNWTSLLSDLHKGVQRVAELGKGGPGTKRKRPMKEKVLALWESFSQKVEIARKQLLASSGMIFSFVEGAFVTALRNGQWILLDEVNLAPLETLQRIIGVLDRESSSLCLAENGVFVERHPNFRLFACMNPATDAGKRDLPYALRSRFTEYFVDDVLDDEDLSLFVSKFLDESHRDRNLVSRIVHFYKGAKKDSEEKLQDGANQRPQYSLRSLYRALEYTRKASKLGFKRALYDGFCMFFMTLLDGRSADLMNQKIISCLLGADNKLPAPIPLDRLLEINVRAESEQFLQDYVLTKSVEEHIRSLARAAFIKRYPVLLQGPTSSGKTSLVQYLAAKTGHEFVRINNHEHTDLQEYLGSYITDANGRLVFHEGVLVKAVRNGHWIVLDELNLAPSDVLEALNRLLDDNREIFVPELRETVRAHPDFMLFATQNPPNIYGGRKMLSRAFRNRFVELHVDEIPEEELTEILEKKGKIPRSYAKKMIDVMKELQMRRQNSKVFAGKHGFITPRDLFRWASRFRKDGCSYEDLARDGYHLLAERLRDESEKNTVQEVLEKYLRVKLKTHELYSKGPAQTYFSTDAFQKIVQTRSMQRLFFLVERCFELREPVLLVGETGGGKTTVCQLLSLALKAKLHVLNCHQYTETSDFIGGFYPIRERPRLASDFRNLIEQLLLSKAFSYFHEKNISTDIGKAPSTLNLLTAILDSCKQGLTMSSGLCEEDIAYLENLKEELSHLYQKWQTIFIWQDGPLVEAMKHGDLLLVDEISLADDSVLERLNSVLEPDRKLSLAEKGGPDLEIVTAHDDFFLLATMNPGGDFGKKELSPALRNRFTEIWVPSVSDLDELREIAKRFLISELHNFVDPLASFWEWYNQLLTGRTLTVRDLLAWLDFVTNTMKCLEPDFAFLHGAFLVLLDGLSLGTGISKNEAAELREKCLAYLVKQLKDQDSTVDEPMLSLMENYGWAEVSTTPCSVDDEMQCDNLFGISPFYIEKGCAPIEEKGFEFLAPTTSRNVMRVLRAMQLRKPVLLEGSPGVGKTSLITAIGKFSGHNVVRINLSDQTDIMDLLGSDLPIESEEGLQFAWSDGILLQALKEGSWVLLDEINLAQQSVLEGLNAILDYRAEVFIPELGRSFKCPSSFRVFACQNPTHQGGGRKGLPKSFLNRFTKVYVDELSEKDHHFICRSLFPAIPESILSKLILFNKRLYEETMVHRKFAVEGSPWEFNLRDVIRSCQIIQGAPENRMGDCFLNVVYVQRMRTTTDRREVVQLYSEVFGTKPSINPYPRVELDDLYLRVGSASIKRNRLQSIKTIGSELKILPGFRNTLEAAVQCIQQQWLCILVGPTASGKTSMIRLLAHLTGNVLNEINLSSATDISELLGSFEQYNAYRNFGLIVNQIDGFVHDYCSLQLDSSADKLLGERRDLITKWLHFSSNVHYGHMSRSDNVSADNWRESLSLLAEIIELLKSVLQSRILSVSWGLDDLSNVLQKVHKLQAIQKGKPVPVKFEWAAGLLIKAIENGEWIVLEDANLCNPTVLDRINSLAESNGSITVNECGNVDGKPLVLFPHPNFRMFLTVNPSRGDVSRAMRNRGIEIVVMQPHWLLDTYDDEKIRELELDDVKTFLALSNIPTEVLADSMAKAHLHARSKGYQLNVEITYLELGRWVHLFQQLLMTGNDLLWSLLKSWEHSYLSSLGESEGWDIVREAEVLYLTKICSSFDEGSYIVDGQDIGSEHKQAINAFDGQLSLCLPGGWPSPLKLTDFVWHSKGVCVQHGCMYLEYLGTQYASYKLRNSKRDHWLNPNTSKSMYLMNWKQLQTIMYPKGVKSETVKYSAASDTDSTKTIERLYFAIDWLIEQVVGPIDIELNLLWFSWFDTQLQPFCKLFGSMEGLLRRELEHPIWKCIFQIRDEAVSSRNVDAEIDLQSVPMLALESVDVVARVSTSSAKRLCNAIKSVGLLRASLQQWDSEVNCSDNDLKSLMQSLRKLEEEVLNVIIDSPIFDRLHQTYIDLVDVHIFLWNAVASSQFESLLVHWRALIKIALKMRKLFPDAVENVLINLDMMANNLDRRLPYSLKSEKSLLWAYGGHPSLPQSVDIFYKLQQFVTFSKEVWPSKIIFTKQIDLLISGIAASTNPELRFLAMQGVCMTSCLDRKAENVSERVEEMYLMLLSRYESEKHKLETIAVSPIREYDLAAPKCCTIIPEIMCNMSGFETWMDSIPIADETSLLIDLLLLEDLSKFVVADTRDLKLLLSGLNDHLKNSCDFSMKYSSRTPLDFVPHQEIVWVVDAWSEIPEAGSKVVSSVHAMWFNWHSSLWNCGHAFRKELAGRNAYEFVLPNVLFKPVKTETVHHIMQKACVIKDYHLHRLKLRVASSNILRSVSPSKDLHCSLLRAARSLFQQIIFAHRKSFTSKDFMELNSVFASLQKNIMTEVDVQALLRLLASSRHRTFVSLVKAFIEPLLREVADTGSSDDLLLRISFAWLRLGGLRFHLLLACDELDPALKYSSKYEKLVNKCNSLSTEIEVRQHCDYLVGSLSSRKSDEEKAGLLEKHESERKRLQKKIVFRSDPGKFLKLKEECNEFSENVDLGLKLLQETDMTLPSLISRAGNWQVTSNQFVDRLSEEYSGYTDIIQPIQVAVYEMKLGMALLLSNALQTDFLGRIQGSRVGCIVDTIYSFMRFPHKYPFERHIQIDAASPLYTIDLSISIWVEKMDLLKKLINSTERVDGGKQVSSFESEASLFDIMLRHVVETVGGTKTLDNASFRIVDKVFNFFTGWWRDMKVHEETKRDDEAQLYRFKPRAFKLDDVCEIDLSSLSNSFSSDSFSEWKELLHDEESVEKDPTDQSESSSQLNVIPESMMHTVVNAHNQLFGSSNVTETPGIVHFSDTDKIRSFIKTYTIGASVVEDLTGLDSSCLDSRLVAEHMFRLCLEHEQKYPLSEKSAGVRNFYKEPNPPAVAGMVPLLLAFREQVRSLLEVRYEDQGLLKILDITEMLLALPASTSVAQALSGLQFLVSRVKSLQEDGAKLPLNDELERILSLISHFRTMEFDTWETMLDEVLVEFERNAGKLWFPLYSVLHRKNSADIVEYGQSTLQSLEELIRTSNLGEFRRRLQLILSFYGQLNAGIYLGSYTSCTDKENRDILYNVFGYYVRLLPIIMKHIETSTKSIKKELGDLVKLCRWERPEKHFYMENSKRNRQKLKKLIQKYNDALQQPVILVLTQESAQKSLKTLKLGHTTVKSEDLFDISQFSNVSRPVWYDDWKNKFDNAAQHLQLGKSLETPVAIPFSNVDGIANGYHSALECPGLAYQKYWNRAWHNLEKICRTVVETADIWKEEGKLQLKTRAFSDLLKLLESTGLSKHKSSLLKLLENSTLFKSKLGLLDDQIERCQSDRWFFLPAYDVHHLLLKLESLSSRESDVAVCPSKSLNSTCLDENWRCANQHYFKSLESVKNLEQISLNFHKVFNPDQVNRSLSFLRHLVIIQMEQRATAYNFAKRLKDVREFGRCLKKLSTCNSPTDVHGDGITICSGQHFLLQCMWQQKELFDSLFSTLNEESLMFKTIQDTHQSTCQNIKTAADDIVAFISKKIRLVEDSKAFLDGELLGGGSSIKLTAQMRAIVITKEMEQTVIQNFQLIRELQDDLLVLREQGVNMRAVDILLNHLHNIFEKATRLEEQFHCEHNSKPQLLAEDVSEMEAGMCSSLNNTCTYISNALQKLGSLNNSDDRVEAFSEKITSGKHLFDSYAADIQLDHLCQELDNIISSAGKLANVCGLSEKTGLQFVHLEELLTLALTFCDGLLLDFLAVHQTVSVLTHNLAEVFACLFSEGYGTPTAEEVDDSNGDKTEDASGTGMGEGVGVKDVSDQITDENQLLGTSKEEKEQDASEEIPSKDVNGIEMDEDLDAPAFSVSEDEGDEDDGDDEGDEVDKLESEMGATGEDGQIADEKLWDKEEDKDLDAANEKYEPGSSVDDKDPNNRELRGKDDSVAADGHAEDDEDASGEKDDDRDDDVDLDKDNMDDEDETEAMNVDKEDMYADPTDIDLNEPSQTPMDEDDKMDVDQTDSVDEVENEGKESDAENGDLENDTDAPEDETLAEAESTRLNDKPEENSEDKTKDEQGGGIENPSKDMSEQRDSDLVADQFPNTQSSMQQSEKHNADSDIQNDFAPSENSKQAESLFGNSLKGNPTDDQQKSQLPQPEFSSFEKNQPNPLRDLGDALQDWKERVKVSTDLPETNKETVDEVMDEAADEYRYTTESEKHTAQALGPAMPDQMEHNIGNEKPDRDNVDVSEDSKAEESISQDTESEHVPKHSTSTSRIDQTMKIPDTHEEMSVDDTEPVSNDDVRSGKPGDSLVSMRNSYMNHDASQVSEMGDGSDEPEKVKNLVEQFSDMKVNAGARWRNYELRTARLSQELAEQLRLIMEPTLASKLQGDYRTGKRINMKKVIPYIASHYRKDKIWLRRTKPNKRDYQVVIVVDDSRSMSENCCGDFAVEALVTVCRALSQLEVGKLAVTSFGKQGNVRLLHDFDQPLTGEAGMQMISSLTFNQENTVLEEPMVDLLKYLNNMLEQAAATARTPSGQNPLQQLVLIIADGRFHDNKEKLKRRVRDLLNRNCMVAFLVLDSAEESIIDYKGYVFNKNGELEKAVTYLDSFPFPYYIVLRNIEALPRTLADLLRQWFELMQYSRD
ncbi:hypothetical protein RND81_04G142700 [Saponaria officinalis]|uniref:Midasin n=1 Tax=Saponaria officinalis TaxID=3572 RepID=A0AAW1LEE8_SAPOF